MPRLLLPVLLLAALLAACREEPPEPPQNSAEEAIPFRQDGTLSFTRSGDTLITIAIEIAATDSARTRGLMQRDSLPEKSGMLFTFPREEPRGFWMGNTPLSLDLFFVGADSQIVTVAKYARPFSPERIESEAPAQYVVEVPAGFADEHGIVEGDRITWQRTERGSAAETEGS